MKIDHRHMLRMRYRATGHSFLVLVGVSVLCCCLLPRSFAEDVNSVELVVNLSLPSTVFVGETLTADVTIRNTGTEPFRFYNDPTWLFPRVFSFDILEGDAMISRPHVSHVLSSKSVDLIVVPPGETAVKSYILYDILSVVSSGMSTLRLRVTDPSSVGAKRFFYSNEIQIRSLPFTTEEREPFVRTELPWGSVSVGNVEVDDGSCLTLFTKELHSGHLTLRRLSKNLKGSEFDIAVDQANTLHIIARKPSGETYYIKCPHGFEIGESVLFSDGKRRELRVLADGTVVTEIGGGDSKAEDPRLSIQGTRQ